VSLCGTLCRSVAIVPEASDAPDAKMVVAIISADCTDQIVLSVVCHLILR